MRRNQLMDTRLSIAIFGLLLAFVTALVMMFSAPNTAARAAEKPAAAVSLAAKVSAATAIADDYFYCPGERVRTLRVGDTIREMQLKGCTIFVVLRADSPPNDPHRFVEVTGYPDIPVGPADGVN